MGANGWDSCNPAVYTKLASTNVKHGSFVRCSISDIKCTNKTGLGRDKKVRATTEEAVTI